MTRRRAGIFLAIALLVAPLAHAQAPAGRVFRVGILSNVPATDPGGAHVWGAFMQGLRELGYVEGQNLSIEHRTSEGRYERLPELAAELIRLNVDVIVVPAVPNAVIVKQATRTIPIVLVSGGGVVEHGLVDTLRRPGGNVTGLTTLVNPEMAGKRLGLLKEAVPRASRIAVLWNPMNESNAAYLESMRAAARSLGVRLQVVEARAPDELEPAFATIAKARAEALVVVPDGMFLLHRTRLGALTTKGRLPAMFGGREHVDAGGLMSYSPSIREMFHRAATYVDRILKGANPGDLPIEQPSRFEFGVNLKTAKAIGLAVPQSVLVKVDEIIQ